MTIEIQVNQAVSFALSVLANVATAVLVLLAGRVIAGAARRLTRKMLERPDVARALGPSIVRLLSATVYYLLLLLTGAVCLVALGVPIAAVLTVLALVVIVLAVALQQSAANLAATVIFLMFQPFRRGELVLMMGYMGTVQEILLFDTVLRLPDGRMLSLPNSKVQEHGILNYSREGRVRADVSLTISYGENVNQARELITQIAARDPRVLTDPPFEVVVDDLGDSGVRLLVFPYVTPDNYWAVRNDMREQIKDRFDECGIHFALPERNLRFPKDIPADGSARVLNLENDVVKSHI